ncbi:uncharacterized protein KQ657_000157 [Scheffersomyces spartinae]|uniref:Cyclin-like domain-containing protein n=1 Tax=Scheffersomyces spartinae TaxID=45513 RepID=A0A9P7VE37_9ASCO|nr:uncharacterized protein KQ657_000157 [Scheffersomyces spartinae]KAG7196145.1 hypothetical protein KQ657_000157 [Scheffersomyces spartinae]
MGFPSQRSCSGFRLAPPNNGSSPDYSSNSSLTALDGTTESMGTHQNQHVNNYSNNSNNRPPPLPQFNGPQVGTFKTTSNNTMLPPRSLLRLNSTPTDVNCDITYGPFHNFKPPAFRVFDEKFYYNYNFHHGTYPSSSHHTTRHTKLGPPTFIKRYRYHECWEQCETTIVKQSIEEWKDEVNLDYQLREMELLINPGMIDLQPEIQWFMRPYLLDFLLELHLTFRLCDSTLFMCQNILDRYCAKRIVFKRHYQLVGCTALWIAAKFEDKKSRVPTLKELSDMCRRAYDEEMFVQMEMHILSTLDWSLKQSTLEDCIHLAFEHTNLFDSGTLTTTPPRSRQEYFCQKVRYKNNRKKNAEVICVARFLCELSLYDRYFLTVPPSTTATCAVLMACNMLGWHSAGLHFTELIKQFISEMDPLKEVNENELPEIQASFLSGVTQQLVGQFRKVCLMLILQFTNITDVLSKKYEAKGVIETLTHFINGKEWEMAFIHKNGEAIRGEINLNLGSSNSLIPFVDSLLNVRSLSWDELFNALKQTEDENMFSLPPPAPQFAFDKTHYDNSKNSSPPNYTYQSPRRNRSESQELVPLTPPSANSLYSVFSSATSRYTANNSPSDIPDLATLHTISSGHTNTPMANILTTDNHLHQPDNYKLSFRAETTTGVFNVQQSSSRMDEDCEDTANQYEP